MYELLRSFTSATAVKPPICSTQLPNGPSHLHLVIVTATTIPLYWHYKGGDFTIDVGTVCTIPLYNVPSMIDESLIFVLIQHEVVS